MARLSIPFAAERRTILETVGIPVRANVPREKNPKIRIKVIVIDMSSRRGKGREEEGDVEYVEYGVGDEKIRG